MRFIKHLALALILAFAGGEVMATQKKLPLTLKQYGKQNYLQWTGTNYVTLTADTVTLYSDTANSYATDPTRLLYDKKINIDRENVNPGERIPEKLCMSVTGRSDADSTAFAWGMYFASSKTGTLYLTGSAVSGTYAGTTNVTQVGAFQNDPGLFFAPKLVIGSATDSLVIQRVQIWGCDD